MALGIALDQQRVFLQEGGWTWRYRNEHCKNQRDPEARQSLLCYFEPLSKCTLQDAFRAVAKSNNNGSASATDAPLTLLYDDSNPNLNTAIRWSDSTDRQLELAVLKVRNPFFLFYQLLLCILNTDLVIIAIRLASADHGLRSVMKAKIEFQCADFIISFYR